MISLYSPLLREQAFIPVVYYYYDRADMLRTTPRETTQTHTLHEIMYVTQGNVEIIASGITYTLAPRQYIWLDAMTPHSLLMPEDRMLSMMNIEYQFEPIPRCCPDTRELAQASPAFVRMLDSGADHRVLTDSSGMVSHLLKLINQLAGSGWADAEKLCSSLAMQLLMVMAQDLKPPCDAQNAACPQLLTDAIAYMEAHYAEPLSVVTIAKSVGASPALLAQLCKAHEGKTINNKLQAIRIVNARELLLTTSVSIDEIVYMVGLSSRKYFMQMFTQLFGTSPVEYRRRFKQSMALPPGDATN